MGSRSGEGPGRTACGAPPAHLSKCAQTADQPPPARPVQVEDSPMTNPAHQQQLAAQLDLLWSRLNDELQPLLRPRGPFHSKVSLHNASPWCV